MSVFVIFASESGVGTTKVYTKSKRLVYKFVSQFFASLPVAATSHLMNKRTGRAASNYSNAWCSLGYANTPIDPAWPCYQYLETVFM